MEEHERQAIVDASHLRVLAICYIVSGGINAFFSLFGLLYAFMGVFLSAEITRISSQANQPPPPQFLGLFFGVIGFGLFVLLAGMAALQFVVAARLQQRRSRTFCMVIAGLTCLWVPYGTVLGVFTFVVLSRRSVATAFETSRP